MMEGAGCGCVDGRSGGAGMREAARMEGAEERDAAWKERRSGCVDGRSGEAAARRGAAGRLRVYAVCGMRPRQNVRHQKLDTYTPYIISSRDFGPRLHHMFCFCNFFVKSFQSPFANSQR
jgi:hypothetical protein